MNKTQPCPTCGQTFALPDRVERPFRNSWRSVADHSRLVRCDTTKQLGWLRDDHGVDPLKCYANGCVADATAVAGSLGKLSVFCGRHAATLGAHEAVSKEAKEANQA